jgi:hypothetical protein
MSKVFKQPHMSELRVGRLHSGWTKDSRTALFSQRARWRRIKALGKSA